MSQELESAQRDWQKRFFAAHPYAVQMSDRLFHATPAHPLDLRNDFVAMAHFCKDGHRDVAQDYAYLQTQYEQMTGDAFPRESAFAQQPTPATAGESTKMTSEQIIERVRQEHYPNV